MSMEVIKRKSTADQVYEVIREAIVAGKIPAGAEINQVDLAMKLGVSRAPIREALRRLEEQGFIRQEAYKRAIVTELSTKALIEVYQVRKALEVLAVKLALQNLTDKDLERAETLVREMDEETNHDRWLVLNDEFHNTIYKASENSFLLKEIETIRANMERFIRMHGSNMPWRSRKANQQHKEMLEAIKAKDIETCCQLLERHLESTLEDLLANIERKKQKI